MPSRKRASEPTPASQPASRSVLSLRLALLVALAAFAAYRAQHLKPYIFSPAAMQRIARAAIADGDAAGARGTAVHRNVTVDSVVHRLRTEFPGQIIRSPPWILNNAGGAMGAMLVLHCSLTEYVIVFGTPCGTEGHTGRFFADDFFTMLDGEQWAFAPGSLEREVYGPGDQHFLPRGTAKQYRMPDSAWALEYARGNILSMLPFGFADSLTSTLDLYSLGATIWVSAVGVVGQLLGVPV